MGRKSVHDKGVSDSSRRFWASAATLGACWVLSRFGFPGWVNVLIATTVFVGVLMVLPRLSSERDDLDQRLSGEKERQAALRQAIREARAKALQFRSLSEKVKDPALATEMERISVVVCAIITLLENDHSLRPRVRSLLDYHLDKGLEVARSYIRLSEEGASSVSARSRLAAGEAVLAQMRHTVEAQLHALRESDFRELEISAESLSRVLREDSSLISSSPSLSIQSPKRKET